MEENDPDLEGGGVSGMCSFLDETFASELAEWATLLSPETDALTTPFASWSTSWTCSQEFRSSPEEYTIIRTLNAGLLYPN
jgi:hypothetical protein